MSLYLRKRRDGGVDVAGDRTFAEPPPGRHHFPKDWVTDRVLEGAATLTEGKLILHASVGDVAYRLVRTPGAYCCHCGDRVGDGPTTNLEEVQRRLDYIGTCEVASNDDDTGDPENPAGYEVIHYYDGELET